VSSPKIVDRFLLNTSISVSLNYEYFSPPVRDAHSRRRGHGEYLFKQSGDADCLKGLSLSKYNIVIILIHLLVIITY